MKILLPMVAACVAGALLVPAIARAAPRDAAPKSTVPDGAAVEEAAKARYAEGVRLFKKHRWEEARAAFLQANALHRRPAAMLMLAQCSIAAGRWLEALGELDAYENGAGELTPKLRDIVDNARAEARAHLGRLRFDVPAGAEVTLDGERVASLEPPLDVMPGSHTVAVAHRGEQKTVTVVASPGETVEVRPSFVPKPLVRTDQTRTRPAPPAAEQSAARDGTSILSPPATRWPLYVAGVIGIGGLATAAILGGLQANASHSISVATETLLRNGKQPSSCASGTGWATADGQNETAERNKYADACTTIQHNEDVSHQRESAFGISLIVGLSGTALAAGWFLLAPKEHDAAPTEARPVVLPWAGPQGGGLTMSGAF